MSCLNRGLFTKPKLVFFSVLIFQQTVILFLLTDTCRGEAEPSQTIRTVVGADVILPCNVEPDDDAVSEVVVWLRPDLEPRFVHVWREGQNLTVQNLTVTQNPSYTGRTSVSMERLKHGDLSLKLSEVKLSDNGTYICRFPSKDKQYSVELVVENEKTPCDRPSFISRTPAGNETLEDWPFFKKDQTPTADPSSSICLSRDIFYAIFTCVAVVLLVLILFAVRKINPTGRDRERESAEDPTPASPERLMSTEREKEDTVSTLIEHQTETTKLRAELLSQLEEVEREKEKNKKRLHSVEKELETETGHKNQELLREKTNLLESKWKLDEMKTEKEKVLLQTDKLLRTIDTVTNKMTGHKLM